MKRGATQAEDIQVAVLQLLHRLVPGICCIAVPSREHQSWTITHPELVAEILETPAGPVAYIVVLRRTSELVEHSEAPTLEEAFGRVGTLLRTFSAAESPPVLEHKAA